jgi:O-antigen/teichoic acid export membrane protein
MVLVMPLLTRIYTPEAFGLFVAATTVVILLHPVLGLRYEAAIPLCHSDADAAALVQLVMVLGSAVALLMVPAVLVTGDSALAALQLIGGQGLLWWLPPICLLEAIYLATNGWALRIGSLRPLAYSKITRWTTVAAVQLLLGLVTGGNPHALLAGFALGQIAAIAPIIASLTSTQRALVARIQPHQIATLARRYKRFPIFATWAQLFGIGAVQLPALLTAVVFGPLAAGVYGLTQRVMGIPTRFIGVSAAEVYTAELASLKKPDRARLMGLFWETVRRLFFLGAIYLGMIALGGPWLFALVFGEPWRNAGLLAQILMPMYMAIFIYQPIQYTLQYFERQDLVMILNGLACMLVVASFWIADAGWIDFHMAILAISLGLTATYAVCFFIARGLVLGQLSPGRPDRELIG